MVMYKVAPLKTSFMVAGLLLMLFAMLYLWPLSKPWSATMFVFGGTMIVASMISMARGPLVGQLPRKPRRIR